jgi:SpoVK/Ycf46/Vps4 family AAA+-type ATPase
MNRAIHQLRWPFDEKENRTAVQDLQGFIQTFQFALTIDGCALLSKTSNEVSDILNNQLETFRRLKELPNYFSTLSINISKESDQVSQILHIVTSLSDASVELHTISGGIQRVEQKLEDHDRKQMNQAVIQKREEVLIWLSTFEYQKKHTDVCARRLADTGQWLLEREEFRNWLDPQSNNVLWCHGIPGAGKTVLSSVVLHGPCLTIADYCLGLWSSTI